MSRREIQTSKKSNEIHFLSNSQTSLLLAIVIFGPCQVPKQIIFFWGFHCSIFLLSLWSGRRTISSRIPNFQCFNAKLHVNAYRKNKFHKNPLRNVGGDSAQTSYVMDTLTHTTPGIYILITIIQVFYALISPKKNWM